MRLPDFPALCGHYRVLTGERPVPQRYREDRGDKISAGVSTGIGDHESKYSGKEAQGDQGDEQFEIDDDRSLEKMYQDISGEGLQPVLNDYLYV